MDERTLLVTGGDGFIGKHLLRRFVRRPVTLVLLTLPRFRDRTRRLVHELEDAGDARAEVEFVEGDITRPNLDLTEADRERLRGTVTEVVHLAAAYDLTLDPEVGEAVNVDGTRHVLNFARELPNLQRLGHMSTTAVSGDHEGPFREDDYDVGQNFHNTYEETKFRAEGLVREARGELPVVIFRPTIVVGHSETGEIEKIDGPYYLFRAIERNMHLVLPDTGTALCHVEPVDFVADAWVTLFEHEAAPGNCYHLADPDPPTYREFVERVCDRWDKPRPKIYLPPALVEAAFRLPGVESLTGVPAASLPYTHLNREYPADRANALLDEAGIRCPPVEDYLDALVDYYRSHRHDDALHRDRW